MTAYFGFSIGKALLRYSHSIQADKFLISKRPALRKRTIAAVLATVGDEQFTPAQLFTGLILRDPNGGARADKVPSAAHLIAALGPAAFVGASFEFTLQNEADAAEAITLTADGAKTTMSGTMTIAQNYNRRFLIVVTNATSALLAAYTCYSLGTLVN